ncbi:hypothetical protein VspSTUT11_07700 [Vibrio sp. STUT-A11]|nr:hypothetical protein VspSTUT11_07700 [Vibrio sp. STUT-A11]
MKHHFNRADVKLKIISTAHVQTVCAINITQVRAKWAFGLKDYNELMTDLKW